MSCYGEAMVEYTEPKGYGLIVDDDPDALHILERIMGHVGLPAQTASDGLEAVAMLKQSNESPPSVILLDLMMPGMDGFEVLAWLRGNPVTRRVPVIVVTAVDRRQLNMLRLPGVAEVVRKGDFTVSSLSGLIRETVRIDSPKTNIA
jgi:CheY-like chemotaxis protein